MEALTAVSIAALTIYDMCKAVDRGMWTREQGRGRAGRQSGWKQQQARACAQPRPVGKAFRVARQSSVDLRWVKDHCRQPSNERADALAVAASQEDDLAIDEVYESGAGTTRMP